VGKAEELGDRIGQRATMGTRGGTRSLGEKNIALHLKLHCVAQI
jgi:hypothetical protein